MNNGVVIYEGQPYNESGDKEIPKVDSIKSCLDSGTELINASSDMFQSANTALSTINTCIQSIQGIMDSAGNTIVAWKEINKSMLAMTLDFERFSKEIEMELNKYQARIPVVKEQLEAINTNVSKILDYALAFEAKSKEEFDFKTRMLERIDSFLLASTAIMTKFL